MGLDLWGPQAGRRFFQDKHWNEPLRWNKEAASKGKSALVFCASMADVFEDHPSLPPHRDRLWELIGRTPSLVWQILTKRPENWKRMVPASWADGWPSNVWAMVTAEDQEWADRRIPVLLEIPANVRGVSYEPAIGPLIIDVSRWGACYHSGHDGIDHLADHRECACHLDWIIVGGESGHEARSFHMRWLMNVLKDAKDANVPVFMKQTGSRVRWCGPTGTDYGGDEGTAAESRIAGGISSSKGDDPSEWPEWARVQEFPVPKETLL
jgi:protein gp37